MGKEMQSNTYNAHWQKHNGSLCLIKILLMFLYILAGFIFFNLYVTSRNIDAIIKMTKAINKERAKFAMTNHISNRQNTTDDMETPFLEMNSSLPLNEFKFPNYQSMDGYEEKVFNFVIDNFELCSDFLGESGSFDILILIATETANFKQRDVLRKTWLSHARNNTSGRMRYGFVMGVPYQRSVKNSIVRESQRNKDIIMAEFVEEKDSNLIKTRAALDWATRRCPDAKYVMKIHDRDYVNVNKALQKTRELESILQYSIGGSCIGQKTTLTYNKEEAEVKQDCSYQSYITSMNVVNQISNLPISSKNVTTETDFMSICLQRLNFKDFEIPKFQMRGDVGRVCDTKSSYVIVADADNVKLWYTVCDVK